MLNMKNKDEVRNKIFELTELYYDLEHSKKEFIPGKTKVAYSGRVFDSEELKYGVDSISGTKLFSKLLKADSLLPANRIC
mgnify:CR=1 FL=1